MKTGSRKQEGTFKISLNVLDLFLALLGCRADFPKLAAYIAQRSERLVWRNRWGEITLLNRSPFGLGNKTLAFRLHEDSLLTSFWWWVRSFPFRIAAHPDWKDELFAKVGWQKP